MKISRFFDALTLHDSVVKGIRYSLNEKLLVLQIELCNYMQAAYKGGPELIPGQLIFSGVHNFKADPPLETFDWDVSVGGDISTSGHVSERDQNELEAAEIVVHTFDSTKRKYEVLILSLLAVDVEWKPMEG